MIKTGRQKKVDIGRLFAVIVLVVLVFGLVLFTVYYDPNQQFPNSFFEDASITIQRG